MRIGIAGKRGLHFVDGLRSVRGIEVELFADPDQSSWKQAVDHGIATSVSSFDELLPRVDAVIVASPMQCHAAQSIEALDCGKHVLSEVTLAVDTQELVRLSQAAGGARTVFSIAENYCYFEENLIVQELVRRGDFGQLYFGEGDYVHEVRALHRNADGSPTWRMKYQVGVPGNTYITHELGPLMRWFRTQDPGLRIVSVACFGSGVHTDTTLNHDDTTVTMIKLSNGALLKLRLDMLSNRPEGIGFSLQGTLGVYESTDGKRAWFGENKPVSWQDPPRGWNSIEQYASVLPADIHEELTSARNAGHGGADYFVGRRFAQAIQGDRPAEIEPWEGIEWTLAGLLSQESIAKGSKVIEMPSIGQ